VATACSRVGSLARRAVLAILVALVVALATFRAASADDGPGDGEGQRKVLVGFYIDNIRDLDVKARTFSIDFYVWIQFPGKGEEYEKLEFTNGKLTYKEEQDRREEKGFTYVCWRASGNFHQNFTLRDYPFDVQRLDIVLEHPVLEVKNLVYAHDVKSYERSLAPKDRWGIRNGLSLPEWRVTGTGLEVKEYVYETDFGFSTAPGQMIGSKYSRLILSIKLERISLPYFFKIVFPLALILTIAYLAFFIPPNEIGPAVSVALFSLLSTVVFYTAVSSNLPEVGYLVASDKFFIATIALIFLNLVQSVWTYNLARRGKDESAFRIEIACRILFPILYAAAFASIFILTLAQQK